MTISREHKKIGVVVTAVILAITIPVVYAAYDDNAYKIKYPKINSTIQDSIKDMEKINAVRIANGSAPIEFDERAYWLALARCKDMEKYNYCYHTNPETLEWTETMKADYGFAPDEYPTENISWDLKYTYADYNDETQHSEFIDNSIERWIGSKWHHYNMMYSNHFAGAIVVYRDTVVFLGINTDGYGSDYLEPLEYRHGEFLNRYYKGY